VTFFNFYIFNPTFASLPIASPVALLKEKVKLAELFCQALLLRCALAVAVG